MFELMLPLRVTVKTALLPSTTLPALLIVKVAGVLDVPLARIVAVPVETVLPDGLFISTTLKFWFGSEGLPGSTKVEIDICCVADPLGVNAEGYVDEVEWIVAI